MGLQTGTQLASTKAPVIDPANLQIVAYELEGPMLVERPSFVRIADVRELSDVGLIVDSSDEFVGLSDVISIEKIYNLNFKLIGLTVIDQAKHKLGKVSNYSLNTSDFMIQQIHVGRSGLRSLSETELLIHRSQIVEINDRSIIVRQAAQKLQPVEKTVQLNYLNPFRTNAPQPDNSNPITSEE
jgi:sporulation protein YlmC with PRC-barrel domain